MFISQSIDGERDAHRGFASLIFLQIFSINCLSAPVRNRSQRTGGDMGGELFSAAPCPPLDRLSHP